MGRNRNKRRHRHRNELSREINSHLTIEAVQNEVEKEQYKLAHEEHIRQCRNLRDDTLAKTVLVTALQDARRDKRLLVKFMTHQYGPIEKVHIEKKRGKFRGRLTFRNTEDAEKIFDGPLEAYGGEKRIPVRNGYRKLNEKGHIIAMPSKEFNGLAYADQSTASEQSVEISTEGMSLGHLFQSGPGKDLAGIMTGWQNDVDTFVEEGATICNPIVKVDFEKGVVSLDITHNVEEMYRDDSVYLAPTASHHLEALEAALGMDGSTIISFRFKELSRPMKFYDDGTRFFLIFELNNPPRIHDVVQSSADFEFRTRLTRVGCEFEDRAVDGIDFIDSCLGYKLEISAEELENLAKQSALLSKMKRFGIISCDLNDPTLSSESIFVEPIDGCHREEFEDKILSFHDDRIRLLLLSILDNHSATWFDMLGDIVAGKDLFTLIQEEKPVLAKQILDEIRGMRGKTRHPATLFKNLCASAKHGGSENASCKDDDFCVSLPRVLLSPLRLSITAFQSEMSNRFVRLFINRHKFSESAFVRLTIGDENGDKLFGGELSRQVEERIRQLILQGVRLGGKTYHFLAYSSSQLKEQSMWLVCAERGWSVDSMRDLMGDFSMCESPSKYAARVGQCFSTTVTVSTRSHRRNDGLRVKDDLPDIPSSIESLVHSDGCGLIRHEVLLKSVLPLVPYAPRFKSDISAIQFRCGGAKGVLVGWDFDTLGIQNYDVCLRPSQIKFKAKYSTLEVVSLATRGAYHLNRQVILLGTHLGISGEVFLSLQDEMMSSLNRMLVDARFAAQYVPFIGGVDAEIVTSLCDMLASGLKPSRDPFLYSCLHATRSHHLMGLRKKARIHVKDGAVLMGGIDETGLLEENQIFIQVSKHTKENNKPAYEVITGRVMVAKHPVIHPGDLRMLEAVDLPELRGVKNVVLFSQHGHRPVTNMMSGSDLDGDEFAICWDRRLFLPRTVEAMSYDSHSPDETGLLPLSVLEEEFGVTTNEALVRHFINHAKNDNLGKISMLWLDHAIDKGSASCSECLELAALHSISVDFPKSSIPAKLPDRLVLGSTFPRAHWREKAGGSPSFHCRSIVGRLYDNVLHELKVMSDQDESSFNWGGGSDKDAMAGRYRDRNGQIIMQGNEEKILRAKKSLFDPSLVHRLGWSMDGKSQDYDLHRCLLDFALEQRNDFEDELVELMNQYHIKSEGEVVTGCVLEYHKLHQRKRYDASEQVKMRFRAIVRRYRDEFLTAVFHVVQGNIAYFGGEATALSSEDIFVEDVSVEELDRIEDALADLTSQSTIARVASRIAALYYMASYSPELHREGDRTVLFSFPWVVTSDVIHLGLQLKLNGKN